MLIGKDFFKILFKTVLQRPRISILETGGGGGAVMEEGLAWRVLPSLSERLRLPFRGSWAGIRH